MQGQQPLHHDRGEINRVLDRMHGEPGPGTDLDIVVMQGVNPVIEPSRMKQPVAEIEMHRMDDRPQQKQQDEPAPEHIWADR